MNDQMLSLEMTAIVFSATASPYSRSRLTCTVWFLFKSHEVIKTDNRSNDAAVIRLMRFQTRPGVNHTTSLAEK